MKYLLLPVVLAFASVVAAQPDGERVLEAVAVEHVPPTTMARWLGRIRSPLVESAIAAPGPVEPAVGAATVREVWFATTRANRDAARQLVKKMDVLPSRVEVRASRVAKADVARLVRLAQPPVPESRISFGFVESPAYASALQNLIGEGRASHILHQTMDAEVATDFTLASEAPPENPASLSVVGNPRLSNVGVLIQWQFQGGAQAKRDARKSFDVITSASEDRTVAFVLHDADANSTQATVVFASTRLPNPPVLMAG